MIRSRFLIGISEVCIFDENSEEVHNLQSYDGLLDENTKGRFNKTTIDSIKPQNKLCINLEVLISYYFQ